MSPHAFARPGALLLGLSMLCACAQVDTNTEIDRAAETVASTVDVATSDTSLSEDKSASPENMTMTGKSPAAPRGPAIPAAELRARILRYISSLQTAADIKSSHVETVLGLKLGPYSATSAMLFAEGPVTEGWEYGVVVIPPDPAFASHTEISLYVEETPRGVSPKTCTYDFKDLAADLVALGYKQSPNDYTLGGKHHGASRLLRA